MSMRLRGRLLAAIFSTGLAGAFAAPACAETLADAIALAYDSNPTLQAQRATQRALDENYVQARSGWAVGWSKPEFWGRAALAKEKADGPRRSLRGLELTGRGIPRGHMRVYAGSTPVGETTSGTFSPTKRVGIALALIDTEAGLADGDLVEIDIRGRRAEARIVKPPFVQTSVR